MRLSVSMIALCAGGAIGFFPQTLLAENAATPTAAAPSAASGPAAMAKSLDSEILRAHSLRVQGSYVEATRVLSQLMLADPDDVRVVSEYGKTLVQEGQTKDAIAFLKRAIELQPNDWSVYSALGVAYDQADDPKSAKAAYDRSLLLKPGNPVVLNNYAISRMLAGDTSSARRMLAEARASGANLPKLGNNSEILGQLKDATSPLNSERHAADANPAPLRSDKLTPAAEGSSNPVQLANGTGPKAVGAISEAAPGSAQLSAAEKNEHAADSKASATHSVVALGTVVMQRVPADSQAGPVAQTTKAPRKMTPPFGSAVGRAKSVKAAPSLPTMLRTADEGK